MSKPRNPWTVVSNITVYENDWIRVHHHEVLRPKGDKGVYGTVHFKNQVIGIVPVDANGNVILVGQYRFPLDAYSWEIPQGGGSHRNSTLESAQRELNEECGVKAKGWLEILAMDISNGVTDERGNSFLAWELEDGDAQPDETEQLEVKRMPFWDAVELINRGEIRDSVTILSLFRVALMALQNKLPQPVARLIQS